MEIDKPDDVEAIGHDLGFGEVLADDGAVGAGQVHTDDAHAVFARQFRQVGFPCGLAAAQHHIEDLVGAQIAEGGRIASFLRKEMFVNAKHPWACGAASFRQLAAQVILKPTLDSGAADPFSPAQSAAIHAIIVREKDVAPERLGGPFPRQDARKPLPKRMPAILATEFARFQFQDAMPQSSTLVLGLAPPFVFQAQPLALTVWAGVRPRIPGRNPNLPRRLLNACNLITRQT